LGLLLIPQAKLVVGLLGPGPDILGRAEELLGREFGPIDVRSEDIPFDFTHYYDAEFGPGLTRRWVSVTGLVAQERLADLKLASNRLEQELVRAGKRQANLDPGLLTLHSLVLATTKAHAHRIYLRDSIYAELTLRYHSGRFEPLDWTYPDYRGAACFGFLARCREELAKLVEENHQACPERAATAVPSRGGTKTTRSVAPSGAEGPLRERTPRDPGCGRKAD
jgi:hypothetical protein